jgi:hypothetical protein
VFARQVLCHLSNASRPFGSYFGDGISRTPGWAQTLILPMPASQVARITDMSHWGLAFAFIFLNSFLKIYFVATPLIF